MSYWLSDLSVLLEFYGMFRVLELPICLLQCITRLDDLYCCRCHPDDRWTVGSAVSSCLWSVERQEKIPQLRVIMLMKEAGECTLPKQTKALLLPYFNLPDLFLVIDKHFFYFKKTLAYQPSVVYFPLISSDILFLIKAFILPIIAVGGNFLDIGNLRCGHWDGYRLQAFKRRWSETTSILPEMVKDYRHMTRDGHRLQTCNRRWSETMDMLPDLVRECRHTSRDCQRLGECYQTLSESADMQHEMVRDGKHVIEMVGDVLLKKVIN